MYTLFEIPQEAKDSFDHARAILPELFAQVTPAERGKLLPVSENLFEQRSRQGKLYLLTEGMVSFSIKEGVLINFEEGDLLGVEQLGGQMQGRYSCTFAVRADEYSLENLYAALAVPGALELWSRYLAHRLNAMLVVVSALTKGERDFHPEVRAFPEGQVIIEQGAVGDEVFTLLEGHAEALVDGVKVGEVRSDEIFGALAALTNTPRTAQVVARENCLVLALPKEKFLELIQNRPHTVLKMVQDMARATIHLNEQVVALKAGKNKSASEAR